MWQHLLKKEICILLLRCNIIKLMEDDTQKNSVDKKNVKFEEKMEN